MCVTFFNTLLELSVRNRNVFLMQTDFEKEKLVRVQRSGIDTIKHDTNGKVTNSQLDTTNESQEVSPFPAGDQKA